MRRTDLSRPSFYVYFRDRHHLVLRVVEHLGAELFTMSDRWLMGTGEGPELARAALDGIVAGGAALVVVVELARGRSIGPRTDDDEPRRVREVAGDGLRPRLAGRPGVDLIEDGIDVQRPPREGPARGGGGGAASPGARPRRRAASSSPDFTRRNPV